MANNNRELKIEKVYRAWQRAVWAKVPRTQNICDMNRRDIRISQLCAKYYALLHERNVT